MPRIIDFPIEGAAESWQDEVRKKSAQETRGLRQGIAASTVRWTALQEGRSRRTSNSGVPARTSIITVSHHPGNRWPSLGWGRDRASGGT